MLTAEQKEQALRLGKLVVEQEERALHTLCESLGKDFCDALEMIFHCRGRLVITGMGKSGHIGKKISASMSSTGTPSFFLHPAEASHGDLGALTKQDVLLAISNSGESQELVDVLEYAGRHVIKIIAVTKNRNSFLGQQADICLQLPNEQEACPIGCAPTSSTTMTLALGDALAMALLDLRGFSAEDFHDFHPGGKLGSKLKRVRDLMHTGDELPLIGENAKMHEAIVEMTRKGLGCIAVAENAPDGRHILRGIISDGDLRRHMSPDLLEKSVRDVMTRNPATIDELSLASKAVGLMNAKSITGLVVLDGQGFVAGFIHMHDCLRAGIE